MSEITIWIVQREHTAEYVAAFATESAAREFAEGDRLGGRMFVSSDVLRAGAEEDPRPATRAALDALRTFAANAAERAQAAADDRLDAAAKLRAVRASLSDVLAAVAQGPDDGVDLKTIEARLPGVPSGAVLKALMELSDARRPFVTRHRVEGSAYRETLRLTDWGKRAASESWPDRDIDVTPKDAEASDEQGL